MPRERTLNPVALATMLCSKLILEPSAKLFPTAAFCPQRSASPVAWSLCDKGDVGPSHFLSRSLGTGGRLIANYLSDELRIKRDPHSLLQAIKGYVRAVCHFE